MRFMNNGLLVFVFGVTGLAAAAAMVVPAPEAPAADRTATPPITIQEARPPQVAPIGQGMVSNSKSSGPVAARMWPPPPNTPIVAIPRIPGPADMMVARGDKELVTLQGFPSNEACDEALPKARYRHPDAFCISTTPPPPPPEHGYLVEVHVESNEWIGLETYPSMAACERALAARPAKPGHQAACTPRLH